MVISLEICQDLRYRCSKWHTTEGAGRSTAIGEGAGGEPMSDYGSWLNKAASKGAELWGKAQKFNSNYSVPGLAWRGITRNSDTPFASMMQREVVNKSDLRGAQLLEGMSNLPIVGNVIRGIQGVNRLEDLYNNTGRTAYYAGTGVSGAGSLGSGLGDIAKIADGVHDLYEFYTGKPDDFRKSQNGMFG